MFRFFSWYFLLLIPLIIFLFMNGKKLAAIKFSSIALIKSSGVKNTKKHLFGRYLVLLGMILLLVALARPQLISERQNNQTMGIDIMMALDVSATMNFRDFSPNRITVAKNVIDSFVSKRVNDRIGLVTFGGGAYTNSPLTLDYGIVKKIVGDIEIDEEAPISQKTAIGMGIAVATNRLKDSGAKSKVIILVTDGDNNSGAITPEKAAQLAKQYGIKIYTIGMGTDAAARMGYGSFNEALLQSVAQNTLGQYFRADSGKALENIFAIIDGLEKTKIDYKNFYQYKELFQILVIIGLLLIFMGLFLDEFLFIRIP